jgi:hypothetical protein
MRCASHGRHGPSPTSRVPNASRSGRECGQVRTDTESDTDSANVPVSPCFVKTSRFWLQKRRGGIRTLERGSFSSMFSINHPDRARTRRSSRRGRPTAPPGRRGRDGLPPSPRRGTGRRWRCPRRETPCGRVRSASRPRAPRTTRTPRRSARAPACRGAARSRCAARPWCRAPATRRRSRPVSTGGR